MKTSAHSDAAPALLKASSWYKDPAVVAAIAAPVAGLAVDQAAQGVGRLFAARQKAQAFKAMLAENPHLRTQDARNTQRYFNTLWAVNPEMARDPIVAGAFVHQQQGSGDESFPHRGILAGVGGMARMRADLRNGAPRSQSRLGATVSQVVRDVALAAQASRGQSLKEREDQFHQMAGEALQRLSEREKQIKQLAIDALKREKRVNSMIQRNAAPIQPRKRGKRVVREMAPQGFDPAQILHEGVNEALSKKSSVRSLRELLSV